MYFTNGDHQAFESLMRDKPGDHYDSGADGPFPECRSCRCHRPNLLLRICRKPLTSCISIVMPSLFQDTL